MSDVVTFWDYDNGLSVVFWGAPTYGTAHFPVTDGPHIERAIERRAVGFDNVAADKVLDMPLGVTRFRAPGDSVDLLVLSKAPMDALRGETGNAAIRADSWLFGRDDPNGFRDSTVLTKAGIERATYRVAPSQYLYRVETTTPGTMVAGRAMQWITAGRDTTTGLLCTDLG